MRLFILFYVLFIIFDVSLFTNWWAMIGKIKVYFDACYSDNVPDVAFNDINKIFLNNSIAQISLLLGQTESLTNELKNSSDYGLMYVFHPKAYNIDLNSFSNNCGYHELINVFLKNTYLKEFTAYCTSTKFKTTRTVLTFPIYSDTEKNILMFIVFDLFNNDYFIFSPFFDINLNNVKEPISSPCQTPHETIVAKVIFICDVLRFNRLSTLVFKKCSEEVITVQSPVDTFMEWESKFPMEISIICKKQGEEMIAWEKDYNLYVNTLFFDKFMKISPLLYQIRDGKYYLAPLKRLMERSEMFNFEITDDAKCDKTTIFGLNDDGFLDYIAKYTHKKVSYLKLPVDESSNDDESFKNMNKVVEKTPENIKSIGDSMKELKERFVASMEVFEKCVKNNTINANLMKECISKFDDLEKTIKSKNKLNDNETHVSELNNQLEGLNIENVDSKKVDTVTNNSKKPDIANVVGVPDSTSSASSSTPANVLTKAPSITPTIIPTTEYSSSTPTKAPIPANISSSTSSNVSSQAPSSIQSNTPTNISTNVSANSSSSTPSSAPSNVQSSIQSSKQTNVPTNVSTKAPSISSSSVSSSNIQSSAPTNALIKAQTNEPSNSSSLTSSNTSSNAPTKALSLASTLVLPNTSFKNSEVRMVLINAIDINNKDLKNHEIEQLDELLHYILKPSPKSAMIQPYIFSFEFELIGENTKQNYESKFSGIGSDLLSCWINLRCQLLENWELVKTGMVVETSNMYMMCSPNLLEIVSNMVDEDYSEAEYSRKTFYFLVHYYLDLPPFRAKWEHYHRNFYYSEKILIVKNSEEKFAQQGNWHPNRIYTLVNHQLVKRIYDT